VIESALLFGLSAGMRSMTTPAALCWASHLGRLKLGQTALSPFGSEIALWVVTALAVAEIIADKLPFVPSRKEAAPFTVRVIVGAMAGFAVGVTNDKALECVAAGVLGAVVGTLGGYSVRAKLASTFKKDIPAALIEDCIAIGMAYYAVRLLA